MPASEGPQGAVFANHTPKPPAYPFIVRDINLALLLEPLDPMRHSMDDTEMLELQDSIRKNGLFQNLCVVPVMQSEGDSWERVTMRDYDEHVSSGGRFRVAAGHRRLLACRVVDHNPVSCKVFTDFAVNEDTIMAGENTHREDPTDFDLAVLYAKWMKEPDVTEDEIRRRAGKTLNFIYARVELLNGYKEVCDALHARKISFTVAKILNDVPEPEFMQLFLNMAIDQGATSKLVRAWVNERAAIRDMTPTAGPVAAPVLHVTAPAFQKIECLLCGDNQSYNLQTVMLCGADVERIRSARAAAEAAESEAGNVAKS
jgi:ParB-like chromosome segregation protein Spo0J